MWKCGSIVRASNFKIVRALLPRHRTRSIVTVSQIPSYRTAIGLPTRFARTAAAAVALRPLPSQGDISQHPAEVYPDDLPIVSAGDRKIAIGWDTRTWSRFHNIWLRDHCRCPKCLHSVTKQRLVNAFDIPQNIKPLHVEPKVEGLEVSWPSPDPHVSMYPWSWLRRHSYDPVIDKADQSKHDKILWGAKIRQSPPSVAYEEAMAEDDRGLFKWLTNINTFGFSFIHDVPVTPKATEALVERIGFIRETQYGRFWDFTSDLAKRDAAYTDIALNAHTDTTYFTDPCGLQLFHLLSHEGSGGTSLLVDGFYAAAIMKELHPDAYALLSRIHVPAQAAGEPEAIYRPTPVHGYPILNHDPLNGELTQVRWNNDDRSVMDHLDPEVVEKWYSAIRAWNDCLTSPDSEFWVQLQPGTAVVIDNYRVLHGRSAFDGKRRMCGAYVGIDEYRSKLAVLREKFAPDPILRTTNNLPAATSNERSVWNSAL